MRRKIDSDIICTFNNHVLSFLDKGSPKTPSVNKKKGASPHKDGPQEEAHKEVLVKEKLRKDSSCAVASKTELDQEKLKTESSTEVSGIEDSTQNEDLHDAARHEKNVSNKNIKKENQQSKNRKSQDKARLPFRLRVKKDVQDSSPDEQASDDETPGEICTNFYCEFHK